PWALAEGLQRACVDVGVNQVDRRLDFTADTKPQIEQMVFEAIEKLVVSEQCPQQRDRQQKQMTPIEPGTRNFRHGARGYNRSGQMKARFPEYRIADTGYRKEITTRK